MILSSEYWTGKLFANNLLENLNRVYWKFTIMHSGLVDTRIWRIVFQLIKTNSPVCSLTMSYAHKITKCLIPLILFIVISHFPQFWAPFHSPTEFTLHYNRRVSHYTEDLLCCSTWKLSLPSRLQDRKECIVATINLLRLLWLDLEVTRYVDWLI